MMKEQDEHQSPPDEQAIIDGLAGHSAGTGAYAYLHQLVQRVALLLQAGRTQEAARFTSSALSVVSAPRSTPLQQALSRSNALMIEGILLACQQMPLSEVRRELDDRAAIERLEAIDSAHQNGDLDGAQQQFSRLAAEILNGEGVSIFLPDYLPQEMSIEVKGWTNGLALLLHAYRSEHPT